MNIKTVIGICIMLMGCALPVKPEKTEPGPGDVVAAAPEVQKGQYWTYVTGNGATHKWCGLLLPEDLTFPLWVGKTWTFERNLPGVTVDVRADVLNLKPVTVGAGTFDTYEIAYKCSARGPMRQTACGDWTVWYAAQAGNVIATKGYSTQNTWELTGIGREAVTGCVPVNKRPAELDFFYDYDDENGGDI